MERVFVSGAAGYIGSALIKHLLSIGLTVTGSVRSLDRIDQEIIDRLRWIEWDCRYPLSTNALDGCDTVVHLAGMDSKQCTEDLQQAVDVNITGTVRLLNACRHSNVRRFIYVSTIHVFGSPLCGILNEDSPTRPNHPYGITHRTVEDLLLQYSSPFERNIVRLSNVVGPPPTRSHSACSLVANDLCRQATELDAIHIRSSGFQRRDFISMEDVVEAFTKLVTMKRTLEHPIFHIGSGTTISIRELAELIVDRWNRLTGKTLAIHYGETQEPSSDYHFSINKMRSLGCTLSKPLHQSLDACLQMLLSGT